MKAKKFFVTLLALMFCLSLVSLALAAPQHAGVEPTADGAGNISIPQLPCGTLVEVVIWNDDQGTTKKLGATHQFKLNPGDGFNFRWRDATGRVWWQLVNKATVAQGLSIDPWVNPKNGKIECKYLFTGRK